MARKILLADDSVTAQNMGRRILGDAGYEVITVNNGSAALKKIAEFKPDVVILDVYMPGYGGLEVCVRIKESPATASIPVLITVGKMEPFKAEEARKVKADAHMVKPFETNELLAAIARLEDKIIPAPDVAKARSSKPAAEKKPSSSKSRFSDDDTEETSAVSKADISKKRSRSKSSDERNSGPNDPDIRDSEFQNTGFRNIERAETKRNAPVENSFSENQDSEGRKSFEVPPPDEFAAGEFPPVDTQLSAATDVETQTTMQIASESAVESTPSLASETSESIAPSRENDDVAATFASADTQRDDSNEKSVFESKRTYRENEVVAALASLVPMASDADKFPEMSEQHATQPPVAKITGPRWVAESVPLSQDEAATMLANEMEKAYAASAAVEGDRNRIAEEAAFAEKASTTAAAEMPAPPEPQAEIPAEPELSAAENVSEASEVVSAIAKAAEVDTETTNESQEKHEDAFAAAASAGAGTELRSEAVSQSAEEKTDEDQNAQRMSSAWANWKQIRESIVGQNLPSNVATPAPIIEENRESETTLFGSSGFKDIRREVRASAPIDEQEPSAPEPSEKASENQTSEISSIVDTMLAELKPKLMEEIARKMGKDSKKE